MSKERKKPNIQYSYEFKIKVVREVESGALTKKEALLKYGIVNPRTLHSWMLKYAKDPHAQAVSHARLNREDRRKAALRVIRNEATIYEVSAEFGVGLHGVWNWVRDVRRELSMPAPNSVPATPAVPSVESEDLRLKVAALEMMIDIAERELNIDIRKKSGTKQ